MAGFINRENTEEVYGGMYIADNSTATEITSSGTWYEVANFVAGSTLNINYSSNSLQVIDDGKYKVTWVASTSAETPNDIFNIGVSINDATPLNNTIIQRKYSNSDVGASAGSAILSLNAGDIIKLEVNNTAGTGDITFSWGNVVLHRI